MNIAYGYEHVRDRASGGLFRWRNEASLAEKVMASMFFAVLMALAAQMRFVLPFTPVPFTGQVLVVLVGAVCLGRFGTVSQCMYLGMGASFGWFTGLVGSAAFIGVTGGYLIGFVLASMFLGEVVERKISWNIGSLSMAMVAAVGIIYTCGVLQMSAVLDMDLMSAFIAGAVPFVAVDGMKIAMAVAISSVLVPNGK
ncbi:MAG: biotin transporter BioY [Methanomassiliicoccales archaeon]|jgi:biotin transport system substrate-specific component